MTDTFKFKGKTYVKDTAYQIAVSGTAYWAHIQRPDKGNPDRRIQPSYSICLVPDEEYKPLLEFLNVRFRDPTDVVPEKFIQPRVGIDKIEKAAAEGRKGPTAPVAVDSSGSPFNGLIGNGSKVDLLFFAPPGQYGIPNIVRIQELVEYEDEEADDLTRSLVSTMYDLRDAGNEVEDKPENDPLDDSLDDMLAAG